MSTFPKFIRSLMAAAIASTAAMGLQAQTLTELTSRNNAEQWSGVGRLDIEGKGFCTAALIREDLILTAAHCIYDQQDAPIDATRYTFSAGLREGRAEAYRDITRVLAHPLFRPGGALDTAEVAHDIAILQLARPIRLPSIAPYPIAQSPTRGETVGIVSYAKDRADAPSLQEICDVLGQQSGVVITTCQVNFGASGSPVIRTRNGIIEIVSVISAMSETNGQPISLGASLQGPLNELLRELDETETALPRAIISGQRRDTGAKFIRP